MRVGRKKTVTHETTELAVETCDICKEEIKPVFEVFNRDSRRLEYAEGDYYPETDYRDHFSFDVCHGCFHDVLQPLLLEKFGANFRKAKNLEGPDSYDEMEKQ